MIMIIAVMMKVIVMMVDKVCYDAAVLLIEPQWWSGGTLGKFI